MKSRAEQIGQADGPDRTTLDWAEQNRNGLTEPNSAQTECDSNQEPKQK